MVTFENTRKKFIVGLLSAGILFGGTTYVEASSYKDVRADNWYVNEITEFTDKGIISGTGDGNFNPKGQVTRAQASKIIWGAIQDSKLDVNMKASSNNRKFKDVKENAWHAPYIYKMQANGIISGYEDGTFRPGNSLTRSQAIKILVESFDVDNVQLTSMPYKDVQSKQWHYPYMEKAYNAGIITRGFDSLFYPNKNITREELVHYTSKAMKWNESKNADYEELIFDRIDRAIVPDGHKHPESYKLMQEGLSKSEPVIYLDPNEVNSDDIRSLLNEFYWGTPSRYLIERWRIYSSGKVEIGYSGDIKGDYSGNNKDNTQRKLKMADDKAESVIKDIIKPGFTDFDKVKAIHDYIVLNTAYDLKGYESKTSTEDAYNIYGTLINGVAVCDGYARTVSYLLDKLGIENYYVVGNTKNGGLHAWNSVKIDNEYYFLDTTWDDPTPNKEGVVKYKYFLINEDTLSKSHTWDKNKYPRATSKRYLSK